ncbi:MAG: OmpH family outer membrane protein [Candidatus Marinamargulisbacteria bacterium]|jgi:outer membrane protein|nr:hypothetical protein [bacterium]MDG2264606.1 OmpH family outer membrane protein [Candidatus Marinamargulisbacteria bacterium]|tara:strand:- start:8000 stop:8464 length:465 start_codon:yes stop_codon:yes gene_type:complete
MRKILISVILTVIVFGMVPAHAEVGLINMQAIFERYTEASKMEDLFQEKRKKYEEKLEKHNEKMTKAREKKSSEKKLKTLADTMQKEMEPLQQELLQFRNESIYSIRQKILSTTQRVAKEQGLDVVMDQQAIVYGGYDLTEFVLDRLNKESGSK